MHLKRIAMPRTWPVPKKKRKYIAKGGEESLPLVVILRDILKVVNTAKEAKKILLEGEVLIDNKKRKKINLPVKLFDIISFPKLKESYRLIFEKGKFCLEKIPENKAHLKTCKVIGKKTLKKGKIQINLHDGKNFLSDAKINDSVVIDLKENKIINILNLKENSFVHIIKGKHRGEKGLITKIEKKIAIIKTDNKSIKTIISNLFIVEK